MFFLLLAPGHTVSFPELGLLAPNPVFPCKYGASRLVPAVPTRAVQITDFFGLAHRAEHWPCSVWNESIPGLICLKSSNLAPTWSFKPRHFWKKEEEKIKVKRKKSKQNTASLKCFQAFGGNYSLSLQIVLVGPKPKLFQWINYSSKKLLCRVSPCRTHSLVLSVGQTQARGGCPQPVQAQSIPGKLHKCLV